VLLILLGLSDHAGMIP